MKKFLGVAAVCLLALAGCGGSEEVKLEGPATLTSVSDCLEKSGVFSEVEEQPAGPMKNPDGSIIRYPIDGTPVISTDQVRVVYEDDDNFFVDSGHIELNETPQDAASSISFNEQNPYLDKVVVPANGSETIVVEYGKEMGDDGIAALKICSSEDY